VSVFQARSITTRMLLGLANARSYRALRDGSLKACCPQALLQLALSLRDRMAFCGIQILRPLFSFQEWQQEPSKTAPIFGPFGSDPKQDLLNCRRKIFNPSLAAPASPRAFGVPTGSVPNRGVWLQSGRESRPWGSVPNRDIPELLPQNI
jgi:hypothetical protein